MQRNNGEKNRVKNLDVEKGGWGGVCHIYIYIYIYNNMHTILQMEYPDNIIHSFQLQ